MMHPWHHSHAWSAPQFPPYRTPFYWNPPWTQPLPPPIAMGAPPIRYPFPGHGYLPARPMGPFDVARPHVLRPSVELHKLLGGRYGPTVIWDVRHEPSEAQRITPFRTRVPVDSTLIRETATRPFVKHMRLVFGGCFSWSTSIIIPRDTPDVVRVIHVLKSIQLFLDEPLEDEDWAEYGNVTQSNIYGAMLERLKKAPPSLKPGGILKIDCLLNRTRFIGLEPIEPDHVDWLVKLGPRRT